MEKEACPFCEIAAGRIPTRRVYEDEHVLAALDINPAAPGHIILFPKPHARTLAELPPAALGPLVSACRRLSHACLRAMQAQGTSIIIAQGEAAGQQAPHLLLHIIPRREQDGLKLLDLPRQPFTAQDLSDVKAMLARSIRQVIEGSP